MTKENLCILVGPTAIGKTDISIGLAEKLNGEIISSDSMQIYKYMDIGSAKVTIDEMKNIPHHLIDIVYPDEEFNVSDYKREAYSMISNINSRGKLPVVAGGTGLYVNSLVYDLNFTEVKPNEEMRSELENLAKFNGNEYIHNLLKEIDPESHQRIKVNDTKRVIRALEIYKETGRTMTEFNKNFRTEVEHFNLAMVGLDMDRASLYERINLRVDIMIENGLIEEVKNLLNMGYKKNLVSMQGIGYKEIIDYLEGNLSKEESIELIKQKSRNYAKRQLTWFRRDHRIKWFKVDEYEDKNDLILHIHQYVGNIIR